MRGVYPWARVFCYVCWRIYCTSTPGDGTAFTIFFPRLLGPGTEQAAAAGQARAPGGDEMVLLVEDESAVRSYTRRVLEGGGYSVLEAGSGESALQIIGQETRTIHLLLTDVVMPGIDGPELSSQLSQYSRPCGHSRDTPSMSWRNAGR